MCTDFKSNHKLSKKASVVSIIIGIKSIIRKWKRNQSIMRKHDSQICFCAILMALVKVLKSFKAFKFSRVKFGPHFKSDEDNREIPISYFIDLIIRLLKKCQRNSRVVIIRYVISPKWYNLHWNSASVSKLPKLFDVQSDLNVYFCLCLQQQRIEQ